MLQFDYSNAPAEVLNELSSTGENEPCYRSKIWTVVKTFQGVFDVDDVIVKYHQLHGECLHRDLGSSYLGKFSGEHKIYRVQRGVYVDALSYIQFINNLLPIVEKCYT